MGADKAAINTAAIKRPRASLPRWPRRSAASAWCCPSRPSAAAPGPASGEAYYDNGRAHSGYDVVEWAKRGEALGAGEILLMSVDNEGLQRGMDLELIEAVTKACQHTGHLRRRRGLR